MQLSRYLAIVPHPAAPGTSLVFSTRRGSLLALPDALLARLRAGEVPASVAPDLLRLGVIVPDPDRERREVLGYLDEVNHLDPGVRAAVFLGLACNFACPYCYEKPLGRSGTMTEATADRLCAFLLGRLRPGKTRLTVDFYGGEPLLYLPLIRRIAGVLAPGAEARGARFRFSLVTNGSLLTPAVVDELLPLGLVSAKVTLDGPPEAHDRSRPLRSGRGSFAAILTNLREVAGLVPVGLGGNYTVENWRRFPELLDYLRAIDLGPDRLAQVMFSPVLSVGTSAPEARAGCASVNEPWLAEAAVVLRHEVLRRGYRTPKIAPSPCMVELTDAFAVNWDGTLTKCPALIGREDLVVGDVAQGVTADVAATFGGRRWQAEGTCRDCAYLPLCFGGCRFVHWQREGVMAGVECQRPFLDATLGATIGQDARYRSTVPGEAPRGTPDPPPPSPS